MPFPDGIGSDVVKHAIFTDFIVVIEDCFHPSEGPRQPGADKDSRSWNIVFPAKLIRYASQAPQPPRPQL